MVEVKEIKMFYIEHDNRIVLFDEDRQRLENTLEFMPQYQGEEIIETDRPIENFQFADTEEYKQQKAEERRKLFEEQFFHTSLGYVKRKVTMKDGSIKDFLSDILPLLQIGVPIITYIAPDFKTKDLPTQNVGIPVTDEFINECKQQVLKDFYGTETEEE